MFVWTGHFSGGHVHRNPIKLTPIPTDRFKVVPALNRKLKKHAVSFEYVKKNGWFVTCKDGFCYIVPKRNTENFGKPPKIKKSIVLVSKFQ